MIDEFMWTFLRVCQSIDGKAKAVWKFWMTRNPKRKNIKEETPMIADQEIDHETEKIGDPGLDLGTENVVDHDQENVDQDPKTKMIVETETEKSEDQNPGKEKSGGRGLGTEMGGNRGQDRETEMAADHAQDQEIVVISIAEIGSDLDQENTKLHLHAIIKDILGDNQVLEQYTKITSQDIFF